MKHYFSKKKTSRGAGAALLALVATMPPGGAPAAMTPEAQPLAEVDDTQEIVTVSLGGRSVLIQMAEDGQVLRLTGNRSTRVELKGVSRSGSEMSSCSRTNSSADGRAECEALSRLDLPRMSGQEIQSSHDPLLAAPSSFDRKSRTSGTLTLRAPRGSIRVPITTSDQLLTRVRLLGITDAGVAVVLAESLRQDKAVLRWRSLISGFDRKGRPVGKVLELGSSNNRVSNPAHIFVMDTGLPAGDYATVNEKGEVGIVRIVSGALKTEWYSLFSRSVAPAQAPANAQAGAARLPSLPDEEARPSTFDFNGFAKASARLDGDLGRASDRPVTRAQVRANMDEYLSASWQMKNENYGREGVENICRPLRSQYWLRPKRLTDTVGKPVVALPYKWGGYVSVEAFVARLSRGDLAGSVCTCGDADRNYCIVPAATGIDCSGFVSRVWGVDRYTTSSLHEISTSVQWQTLALGDVVNKPSNHVRVFTGLSEGSDIGFRIAESSVSCGGVCEKVIGARELEGYEPRRFKHIVD